MESDLNTLQLISMKKDSGFSSAGVNKRRGGSVVHPRNYEYGYLVGVTNYQSSLHDQMGLRRQRKEALRLNSTTGNSHTGLSLLSPGESSSDHVEGRCASRSSVRLEFSSAESMEREEKSEEDEDKDDPASMTTKEIVQRRLLRRERAILHRCDVLNRHLLHAVESNIFSVIDESGTTRTDKVKVFIRVLFLKIGQISTSKETYTAEVFIQAKWREPSLDGTSTDKSVDSIDLRTVWNPNVFICNTHGELDEQICGEMTFDDEGKAFIIERRMIKGFFQENLELKEFPFDTQDLTLTLTSERIEDEVTLEIEPEEVSGVNVQTFSDEQEWQLHNSINIWKGIVSRTFETTETRHSTLSAACRASRRPGFFLWNVFLVMLFICGLGFSTFTVDLTLSQNRLLLSFFLLLTTITFKFVVNQQLPRISYLTHLDKYVLTCMAILCCVCAWHAIVPLLKYDLSLAKKADTWVLIAFGFLYLISHLCFFLFIYCGTLSKRRKFVSREKDNGSMS